MYAIGPYPASYDTDKQLRTDYRVVNDTFVWDSYPYNPAASPFYGRTAKTHFYRYNVMTGESDELTPEQIGQLRLDPAKKSPDGFRLGYAPDNDSILEAVFDSRSSSERVLAKGSAAVPVTLVSTGNNRYDVDFIGWVLP